MSGYGAVVSMVVTMCACPWLVFLGEAHGMPLPYTLGAVIALAIFNGTWGAALSRIGKGRSQ